MTILSIMRVVCLTASSVLAAISATSCGGKATATQTTAANEMTEIAFDADSAYAYIARQVEFGPRVSGTPAANACADWLIDKLNAFGAKRVIDQHTQVRAYTGEPLNIRNISASFNPDADRRILLLAHRDSRPWADQDPDPARRNQPIDGANDGASGVGVILEIARNLSEHPASIGVDILFVDAEDYGCREDYDGDDDGNSWCLGTQYWVANPTFDPGTIEFAILLDMVGGRDAVFPRDYYSLQAARPVVNKVWSMARRSGYGDRFIDAPGTPVLDDHIYLLQAGIPAIDIIETAHPETGSFNPTWHTHADNLDNIDKATLKAVGQTLNNLIYNY